MFRNKAAISEGIKRFSEYPINSCMSSNSQTIPNIIKKIQFVGKTLAFSAHEYIHFAVIFTTPYCSKSIL